MSQRSVLLKRRRNRAAAQRQISQEEKEREERTNKAVARFYIRLLLTEIITSQSKFDVTLDRFASRLAAEFIIFMEFFSLILGVDQLAASRLQLDSRNLPEFL
ncbi:hypothetical protein AVEN_166052-1 [Araneus ventricosus]|uniref:Uncharacterized protein n=1 Tax=Araneus ventricosus TaxID=182803 RepID=A0A4Y2UMD8_ARAVE|nr:hypothetical protein AVEN_166052-1 [Araneus ventricosus]